MIATPNAPIPQPLAIQTLDKVPSLTASLNGNLTKNGTLLSLSLAPSLSSTYKAMDMCISCNLSPTLLSKQGTKRRFHKRASFITKCELKTVESNPTSSSLGSIPIHRVTVHDRQRGVVHEFFVPEDQYILHTAESQDINLPFACRHGCCTSCAVRVKSGQIRQPEALGISAELKTKGYALLCVGFPSSDLEVETQDEDEVYWLQFGRYFARGPVERDDYALELAMADE